jgi:hypothetical protein
LHGVVFDIFGWEPQLREQGGGKARRQSRPGSQEKNPFHGTFLT